MADAGLTLEIANDYISGSNLEFDILISADASGTYLDNCVMDIYFSNNVGNYLSSAISYSVDPYFFDPSYVLTWFDYNSNIVHLQYGSDSALTSWNRVEVPTTYETFMHLSVPVADCYQTTYCNFQNVAVTAPESYYTNLPDDDINLYPIQYIPTHYPGFIATTFCYLPPEIQSFTDTLYAGTYYQNNPTNMSNMVITGLHFGNTEGTVYFRNANMGSPFAFMALNHYDIQSWSDNIIKLTVPGRVDSSTFLPDLPPAGGGYFYIKTANGQEAYSTSQVYFRYTLANMSITSPYGKFRYDFKKVNVDGSLTFLLDTSIIHYPDPMFIPAIKRALADWVCETHVDFKIGGADSGHITTPEYSVIYLADALSDPHFVGETYRNTITCSNSIDPTIPYIVVPAIKIGILRNPAVINSHFFWWLDTLYNVTTDSVPTNGIDLFELLHHEFGHASGEAHTTDSQDLMYFSQSPGWRQEWLRRGIRFYDANGGIDVVKKSAYFNSYSFGCSGYNMPEASSGSCLPGWDLVPILYNKMFNIKIFPNPLNNALLNITYQLQQDMPVKIEILDITSRTVFSKKENKNAGPQIDQINLDNIAVGIYMIKISIGDKLDIQKLVKIR